jgi:hypothetical protein
MELILDRPVSAASNVQGREPGIMMRSPVSRR